MTLDAWLTLGLLVATLAALLGTKLPPALVFMGALTVSITLGLAPLAKSLAGFSNDGVITVGVLFMVAAGMYSTGAITLIGEKIIGTPKSEDEVQLRVLPPVALGSAFLNNTPLVAMTIPVIRDLCVTRGFAASRLFIPISYASILGGTTTLIGTSVNLIIGGLILDQLARGSAGAPPMRQIQMFDPAWVAVPGAVLGIAFIILAGRWLLPTRESGIRSRTGKRIYGAEFVLRKGSPEVGKTLEEAGLADPIGFELKGGRHGHDPDVLDDARRPAIQGGASDGDASPHALPRRGRDLPSINRGRPEGVGVAASRQPLPSISGGSVAGREADPGTPRRHPRGGR
jgi:di/tricarboxylate transporter